jgi:hypothetical protein
MTIWWYKNNSIFTKKRNWFLELMFQVSSSHKESSMLGAKKGSLCKGVNAYRPFGNPSYYLPHLIMPPQRCLPLVVVLLSLQKSTFKCSPSSYCHVLATTLLWQLVIYCFRGYLLICPLVLYSRRNTTLPWKRGNIDCIILNYYIFSHLLIEQMHIKHIEIP